MLNLQEIEEAIAELEAGKTSFGVCARLADLYAVRDHLRGDTPQTYTQDYSFAATPPKTSALPDTYNMYADSEFLEAVEGKDADEAWRVVDDLMDTLRVVNPRVYDSVLRKMKEL